MRHALAHVLHSTSPLCVAALAWRLAWHVEAAQEAREGKALGEGADANTPAVRLASRVVQGADATCKGAHRLSLRLAPVPCERCGRG